MDVQEFTKRALLQIVAGVEDAQRAIDDAKHHGEVNPDALTPPAFVEFDIAVTASEGTSAGGGVGIRVVGFQAGGGAKTDTRAESVSRIRFSVPIRLSHHAKTVVQHRARPTS
jgi:hypothetical protein